MTLDFQLLNTLEIVLLYKEYLDDQNQYEHKLTSELIECFLINNFPSEAIFHCPSHTVCGTQDSGEYRDVWRFDKR